MFKQKNMNFTYNTMKCNSILRTERKDAERILEEKNLVEIGCIFTSMICNDGTVSYI